MTKLHFSLNQTKPSCDYFNKTARFETFLFLFNMSISKVKKLGKDLKFVFVSTVPMSRRCKEVWNQNCFTTKKRSCCVAVRFFCVLKTFLHFTSL